MRRKRTGIVSGFFEIPKRALVFARCRLRLVSLAPGRGFFEKHLSYGRACGTVVSKQEAPPVAKARRTSIREGTRCDLPGETAAIAQLVEHLIRNEGVGGSNPSCGTRKYLIISKCYSIWSVPAGPSSLPESPPNRHANLKRDAILEKKKARFDGPFCCSRARDLTPGSAAASAPLRPPCWRHLL